MVEDSSLPVWATVSTSCDVVMVASATARLRLPPCSDFLPRLSETLANCEQWLVRLYTVIPMDCSKLAVRSVNIEERSCSAFFCRFRVFSSKATRSSAFLRNPSRDFAMAPNSSVRSCIATSKSKRPELNVLISEVMAFKPRVKRIPTKIPIAAAMIIRMVSITIKLR